MTSIATFALDSVSTATVADYWIMIVDVKRVLFLFKYALTFT